MIDVAALLAEETEYVFTTADWIFGGVFFGGFAVLMTVAAWQSMCRQVLRKTTGELHGPWRHDFGPEFPHELSRKGRIYMGTRRTCRRCGFELVHDPEAGE